MQKALRPLMAVALLISLSVLISGLGGALAPGKSSAEGEHIYEICVGAPKVFKHGEYDIVKLPWGSLMGAVGKPMLPMQVWFVLEPPGGIESFKVEPLEWKELSGTYNIPPAPPPACRKGPREVQPDPEVYNSDQPYPGVLYSLSDMPITWRGLKYRLLVLYPLQYIPVEKKLRFYESFRVRIRYGPMGEEKAEARPIEPIFTDVVMPKIVNKDILTHAWSINIDSNFSYLIITREMFLDVLQPFVDMKTNIHHEDVFVQTVEWIASHWSGYDVPEKIRNYIRNMYQYHSVDFVLLFGDADPGDLLDNYTLDTDWDVPTRYVYNPDMEDGVPADSRLVEEIFGRDAPSWVADYTPTDYYYACLDGTWDDDGDHRYGESKFNCDLGVEEVDWAPEVYVGRIPVSSEEEAEWVVNKLCNYLGKVGLKPAHRYKVFLLIGCLLNSYSDGADVKERVADMSELRRIKKLYESGGGDGYPTFDNVKYFINTYDPILINSMSHGDIDKLDDFMYSTLDYYISNSSGFLITAYACDAGAFDGCCLGESLLISNPSHTNGSAVAFIGYSRAAWYWYYNYDGSGEICLDHGMSLHDIYFWHYFFLLYNARSPSQSTAWPGMVLHEATYQYACDDYLSQLSQLGRDECEKYRKNVFAINLLGDPSFRIFGVPSWIDNYIREIVERASSIKITGHDFLPGATIQVLLSYVDPYTYTRTWVVIATTKPDSHGRLQVEATIPEDAPLGPASIVLRDEYGNFVVAGRIVVVRQAGGPPTTPPPSGQDADSDLWPDNVDPWPDNPWLPNLAIAGVGIAVVAAVVVLLKKR